MTMNPPIAAFALSMPITTTARAIAQRFAQRHSHPQKAEQVRLNTLAVCIVNDYLQLLAIPTDLNASDSWNPLIQHCSDTADLLIPQVGYLECRPMGSDVTADSCFVPPEVWENRVGYVVVQLNEAEREGVILGFCPHIAQTQLPLSRLQPIEAVVDVLNPPITQLRQWLQQQFDQGWQTVDSLLNPPQLAFRSQPTPSVSTTSNRADITASRGRVIDLSTATVARSVVLTVDVTAVTDTQTALTVRVFPAGDGSASADRAHLFPTLQLAILDELHQTFQVVVAQALDDYIQLQFNGEPQERFHVRLTLDDVSVTETFVI